MKFRRLSFMFPRRVSLLPVGLLEGLNETPAERPGLPGKIQTNTLQQRTLFLASSWERAPLASPYSPYQHC